MPGVGNCLNVTIELAYYAQYLFPNQFSLKDNKNLKPYDIGFT